MNRHMCLILFNNWIKKINLVWARNTLTRSYLRKTVENLRFYLKSLKFCQFSKITFWKSVILNLTILILLVSMTISFKSLLCSESFQNFQICLQSLKSLLNLKKNCHMVFYMIPLFIYTQRQLLTFNKWSKNLFHFFEITSPLTIAVCIST